MTCPVAAARRFVVSANLMRRHLDTSQRAMIAARFATLGHGQTKRGTKSSISSVADAAAMLNVGTTAVKDARTVLATGDADMIAKVERGFGAYRPGNADSAPCLASPDAVPALAGISAPASVPAALASPYAAGPMTTSRRQEVSTPGVGHD